MSLSQILNLKEFFLKNKSIRQTVSKNAFWLTIGQVGSRLFRALIIIYAARILGVGEYGIFSYVLGLAGFFTLFADVGVNSILTRDITKHPDKADNYFATAFWIKIFLLLVSSILVIFVAPYFSKIEGAKILIPLVALLNFFDGIREFSSAYFRAKERMELEAFTITLTNIAITVFGIIVLSFQTNAKALVITYILSAGTGTIASIALLKKQFSKVIKFFKSDLIKEIISSAWPIALLSIIGIFMTNIDVIMLGFFKTGQEVGLYSSGQRIIQILYTLPAIISTSFFPVISRFVGQKDNIKTRLLIEKGLTVVFLIGMPLIIGGIILGENIINLLYGSEYLPATLSFQILILNIIFVFPSYFIGSYIFAYNEQKRIAPYLIIGSLVNVALNALLIPFYGIAGAAIATLCAQAIYQSLLIRLAKKVNNFQIITYLKKIVLASIIMGGLVYCINLAGLNVILNIIISGIAYFVILYLIKENIVREITNAILNKISLKH